MMRDVGKYNSVKSIELRDEEWNLVDTLSFEGTEQEQVMMGVYRGEEGSLHLLGNCHGFALTMVAVHIVKLIKKQSGLSLSGVLGMIKIMAMMDGDVD